MSTVLVEMLTSVDMLQKGSLSLLLYYITELRYFYCLLQNVRILGRLFT